MPLPHIPGADGAGKIAALGEGVELWQVGDPVVINANLGCGKCDFCLSRWNENKLPICVEACPTRAFDAGDMDDLKARYGDITEAEGFAFSKRVTPSVVFTPKKEK